MITAARITRQVIDHYDALLAEGRNCGGAALQALAPVAGVELDDPLLRIGSVHAFGSHIGNRCAIVQAALSLCSLLYGRETGDGFRLAVKTLAGKLQTDVEEALGHCHCAELNPAWESGQPCDKRVSDAVLDASVQVLCQAPAMVSELMDGLKRKYRVHESLWDYTEYFMIGADWELVHAANAEGAIDVSVFKTPAVEKGYRRGVIDKVADEGGKVTGYQLGGFHRRIDCFLRGERAKWLALPQTVKDAVIAYEQDIGLWVLPRRQEGANQAVVYPLPLEQALEIVDRTDGTFFLQECDCRIYHDSTAHPVDVCLHFPDSLLNTNADRGYGRVITREEAREVMRRSDASGLVHNFEEDAFCNCCGCCCWALRGIEDYRRQGLDPFAEYIRAPYVIQVNDERCVGCGACVPVCPVDALAKRKGSVAADLEKCIGCGVCRAACRKNALAIREREGA